MTSLPATLAADRAVPLAGTASRYLPSLDGLRALSIMLVVVSHAGLGWIVPGGLGVTVFFVISGFLITRQMIEEIDATATLGLRQFYLRRIFRLAPALLVFIALVTPISMAAGVPTTLPDFLAGLLYSANYWILYVGFPPESPYSILWSLAVEEHFYIVFPLVVLLFTRDLRRFMPWLLGAAVLALAWRIYLEHRCGDGGPFGLCGISIAGNEAQRWRQYLATDTRFDSILFGALLALGIRFHPQAWRRYLLGLAPFGAAMLVLLLTLVIRDPFFRNTWRYTVQSICLAVIVGNVLFGPADLVRRLLSLKPVTYVGRLSYSLYLYHWGVLIVIAQLGGQLDWRRPEFAAFYVLSFALAAASYHLVERPMVRFRRQLGSRTAGQTG